MARRPRQHEIGDRGVKIVTAAAPDHWVPQEQSRDYGVDLKFEVFRDGQLTGQEFGAQVRGTDSLRTIHVSGKQFVTCAIEVENLKDHLEKRRYPIYVLRVDNCTGVVYWEFLQQQAKEVLDPKWREQKTVTIRIPVENTLADISQFEASLERHVAFVNDLHPGSVDAALKAEKHRMESLDPRFEVSVAATQDGTNYSITPKEEGISFKLSFKGEEAVEKAKRLIEAGEQVSFSDEEATLSGISEDWYGGGELALIEVSHKAPCEIRFAALDPSGNVIETLNLNGEFSGGSKRGAFQGGFPEGLLTVDVPVDSERNESEVRTSLDWSSWVGLDVRTLPYLDVMSAFFESISSETFSSGASVVELHLFLKGNRVMKSLGNKDWATELRRYVPIVMTMNKARVVAKELNEEILVPSTINEQSIHDVELVYNLLRDGRHQFPTPNATASIVIEQKHFEEQKDRFLGNDVPLSMYQGGSFPFLATTVDIGYQKVTLSAVKIDESKIEKIDPNKCKIYLTATTNCVYMLEQCNDAETEQLEKEHKLPISDSAG